MSNKKNIGFITAFAYVVGTIVGVGVFFKNTSIVNTTGSGIYTLLAWIVGGIGVLFAVIALLEVISCQKETDSGVISWATTFVNKKYGRTITWFLTFLYFPFIYATLSFYGANYTWAIFGFKEPWWANLILTLFYMTWFISINSNFIKLPNITQNFATFFKLFPLIVVVFAGLITSSISNFHSDDIVVHSQVVKNHGFLGMILALPAVFYAFDGFYYVFSIKRQVRNANKVLPRVVIFGVVSIIIFYALISVALFSKTAGTFAGIVPGENTGSVIYFAHNAFPFWFHEIIDISVVIAALGSLNGFTTGGMRMVSDSVDTPYYFPWKKTFIQKNENGSPRGTGKILFLLSLSAIIFSFLIGHFVFKRTLNFIDVVSNWQTAIMLFMIGVIFIFAVINRYTNKVITNKVRLFKTSAIIGAAFFIIVPVISLTVNVVNTFKKGGWTSTYAILDYTLIIFIVIIFAGYFIDVLFKKLILKSDSKFINHE